MHNVGVCCVDDDGESRAVSVAGYSDRLSLDDTDSLHSVGTGLRAAEPRRPCMVSLAVVVFGMAFAIMGYGFGAAPALFDGLKDAGFEAPEGSDSLRADAMLKKEFPLFSGIYASQVVMVIQAEDPAGQVLTESLAIWSLAVADKATVDDRVKGFEPLVYGYYVGVQRLKIAREDPLLLHGYVAPDNRTMLLVFVATRPPPDTELEAWKVREYVISFLKDSCDMVPIGNRCLLTGNPVLEHDNLVDKSNEAMLRSELCLIPVALIVMVTLVGNCWLLLIPPFSLATTVAAAIFCVRQLVDVVDVPMDTPSAMLSVCMALSLDYSLFMLTRFQECRAEGMSVQGCVDVLMTSTSVTITVSALLISIAFFGAMLIPEDNLKAVGLCLGVTTLVILVVNAILTPMLLLLFGDRLTKLPSCCDSPSALVTSCCCAPEGSDSRTRMAGYSDLSDVEDAEEEGKSPSPPGARGDRKSTASAGYIWLMLHVEKRPLCWVVGTILLFLPLLLHLPVLHTTSDLYATLPRSLPSIEALHILHEEGFPPGRFDPYAVLVTRDLQEAPYSALKVPGTPGQKWKKSPILTEESFAAMLEMCDALWDMGPGISGFLGPVWLVDTRVTWDRAKHFQVPGPAGGELAPAYETTLRTHVNGSAALLQIHTEFLPRGPGAAEWVEEVRLVLEAWEAAHPGYNAYLAGGATQAADARMTVDAAMPVYLGISVAGIMALVFLLFRSLVLPLRLAWALLFTLAATFSVAVVVYQTTLFHPYFPWLASYYGLTYESVPLVICLAVALGLDYDIFLVSRICEYRLLGYSDRDSIVEGVARSGHVISGAGLVMALCFAGLGFSTKLQLQQLSVLLVSSVLLDTFVVRTVLVPALMLSAGTWNWWPRTMPEPCRRPGGPGDGSLMASKFHEDRVGMTLSHVDTISEFDETHVSLHSDEE